MGKFVISNEMRVSSYEDFKLQPLQYETSLEKLLAFSCHGQRESITSDLSGHISHCMREFCTTSQSALTKSKLTRGVKILPELPSVE